MTGLARLCVVLAAVTFLLAVVTSFTGPVAAIPAEAFSRACTNLALLAVAVILVFPDPKAGGPLA